VNRTLAPVDFEGKVRARDPETSWDAAKRQTRVRGEKLRAEIVLILDVVGPMTDDELYAFRERIRPSLPTWKAASPQSIRSRRNELKLANRVREARDADGDYLTRPSNMGNRSQVWELHRDQ